MWNILFPHVTHCLSINVPLVKSGEYQIPFELQLAAQTLNQNYTQLSIRTYNDVSNHNNSQCLNNTGRQSVFLEKYAVFTLATKSLFSMTLKKRRKLLSFSLTFFFKNFTSNISVSTKPQSMEIRLWLRSVQILSRRICQWCLLLEFWNALREKSNIFNLSIMFYKVSVFSTGNFIHNAR